MSAHGPTIPMTSHPCGPLNGTADEHDDEDDAREREHMEERA